MPRPAASPSARTPAPSPAPKAREKPGLAPDIDPALALTIERAMSPDPRWRFATAEQMRASIAARRSMACGDAAFQLD